MLERSCFLFHLLIPIDLVGNEARIGGAVCRCRTGAVFFVFGNCTATRCFLLREFYQFDHGPGDGTQVEHAAGVG